MIHAKETTMNCELDDLVELGTVTGDTAGDWGLPLEAGGRMPMNGLDQD